MSISKTWRSILRSTTTNDGETVKVSKRKRKLTDAKLLEALTELGGTGKAPEIGKMLGFSERTIRYRLQRLKEKGHLYHEWPQTLDVKLGLCETGLFLEPTEEYRDIPRDFLLCFKNLYINYATYGRYNGHFAAGGYPRDEPQLIDKMTQALKKMNIIKDCFRFDTIDYIPLSADLSRYSPTTGWNWDWREWLEQSEKAIKDGEPLGLDIVWDHGTMDYDHKDIAIVAEIKAYGYISPKQISKNVGLSDTQVRARIRRLMDEKVLRGSVWLIPPSPDSMILYTFVELDPSDDSALTCYKYLPFRKEVFVDKPNKYCIKIVMNSRDLVGYLKAFETLRIYFDSYFFQTALSEDVTRRTIYDYYHLHKESTGRWEMPIDEYIQNLEKFMEDY